MTPTRLFLVGFVFGVVLSGCGPTATDNARRGLLTAISKQNLALAELDAIDEAKQQAIRDKATEQCKN